MIILYEYISFLKPITVIFKNINCFKTRSCHYGIDEIVKILYGN